MCNIPVFVKRLDLYTVMSRMSMLVLEIVLVSLIYGFKRSYSCKYICALYLLRKIPKMSSTNLRSSSGRCRYGSDF